MYSRSSKYRSPKFGFDSSSGTDFGFGTGFGSGFGTGFDSTGFSSYFDDLFKKGYAQEARETREREAREREAYERIAREQAARERAAREREESKIDELQALLGQKDPLTSVEIARLTQIIQSCQNNSKFHCYLAESFSVNGIKTTILISLLEHKLNILALSLLKIPAIQKKANFSRNLAIGLATRYGFTSMMDALLKIEDVRKDAGYCVVGYSVIGCSESETYTVKEASCGASSEAFKKLLAVPALKDMVVRCKHDAIQSAAAHDRIRNLEVLFQINEIQNSIFWNYVEILRNAFTSDNSAGLLYLLKKKNFRENAHKSNNQVLINACEMQNIAAIQALLECPNVRKKAYTIISDKINSLSKEIKRALPQAKGTKKNKDFLSKLIEIKQSLSFTYQLTHVLQDILHPPVIIPKTPPFIEPEPAPELELVYTPITPEIKNQLILEITKPENCKAILSESTKNPTQINRILGSHNIFIANSTLDKAPKTSEVIIQNEEAQQAIQSAIVEMIDKQEMDDSKTVKTERYLKRYDKVKDKMILPLNKIRENDPTNLITQQELYDINQTRKSLDLPPFDDTFFALSKTKAALRLPPEIEKQEALEITDGSLPQTESKHSPKKDTPKKPSLSRIQFIQRLVKIVLAFISFLTVLIPAIVYAVWKWKEKHPKKSPAEKSNSELDPVFVDETVFFKSYLTWQSPFPEKTAPPKKPMHKNHGEPSKKWIGGKF